jgi:hypothetical protein
MNYLTLKEEYDNLESTLKDVYYLDEIQEYSKGLNEYIQQYKLDNPEVIYPRTLYEFSMNPKVYKNKH